MPYQEYEMFSGNTKTITIPVVDKLGNPVDVTGSDATYIIAPCKGDPAVVTKTVGDGITITTTVIANDSYTFALDAADTEDLAGTYYHELEIIDSGGQVSTGLYGHVKIREEGI